MRTFHLFRQFLDDIRAQKLRTALTVLGITWGTVAVVVLLAFGVGLAEQMKRNARGMGDGIVIVFGGRTTRAYAGFGDGRLIRLREEDATLIAREVPGIEGISPEYGGYVRPVRRGTTIANPYITGVLPVYGDLRNIVPEPGGRFLNELDVQGRRRVAVLGDELKKLLFGDAEAVGQQIFVGEVPFTVVGVMQHKTQNSSYRSRDQDRLFIPASTYRALFGERYIANLVYRPANPEDGPAIERRIYELLGRRHRFDPADRDALAVWDTNEMMRMFHYLFLGFNLFLGVVGSFTLTVGGIGVANIMFVVVRERTREIGVKRSLGARRRDILLQFLVEALLIVAAGAVLGFLLSATLIRVVRLLPIQEAIGTPAISPVVLGATLALLALVALAAGLLPARRAAALDPVECLRYGV
ncbi:MAG TPA: ABC transporter permease [Longimicrobiales bacterium]